MSENEELKAAVLFSIGISPAPIVKIDRLTCAKLGNSMFSPAISTTVSIGGAFKEADFPVYAFDTTTEKSFEELRAIFHKRVDQAFDGYKQKWQKAHNKDEELNNVRELPTKESEAADSPEE